jgi:predicted metal-binding membrane protein
MAQAGNYHGLTSLAPAGARLGHAFARSKVIAVACIVVLALVGWLYLALMIVRMAENGRLGALGPGMGLLDLLAGSPDLLGRALFDALCRPGFGGASFAGLSLVNDTALAFVMWCAMWLAMMLPTAGPMIVTYAELADTAARKHEEAVSPLVLIAGYAAVWFGFAALAAALQVALTRAALLDPAMASASPLFSGAIFVAAGAYQFSALKEACVSRCHRPFPFFFANWSREKRVIFRLGLQQGIYCLGCCWAAMLAMFAVGVMNVVWMAAVGLVMMAEKIATTLRLTHALGAVFIAIGLVFIGSAVLAQWPTHPV